MRCTSTYLRKAPAEEGHQRQQVHGQTLHVQHSLSIQHIIGEQVMSQQGGTLGLREAGGDLGEQGARMRCVGCEGGSQGTDEHNRKTREGKFYLTVSCRFVQDAV